ncbi:L-rhamnose-1-dehydrogenase [Exophiala dermatitidis]
MSAIPWPLLRGKTAAITGGTTGIGRAISLEFLRQGCNVAINHLGLPHDEQHRRSLHEEAASIRQESMTRRDIHPAGEIIDLAGDVSLPETGSRLVQAAVDRFGKLDVFVANAGIFQPASFLGLDHDLFDKTVRVNLNGSFYACQAAARQMVKQGHGGSIIAVSSISALQGGRMQTHYTPTKAGILSMIQSMAISMGEHNIRCNALMPGTIKTRLSDEEINDEGRRKALEAKIPLGRAGVPQDMAGPAVFLACEQMSGFMNGAGLLVDGGMFAYLQ